MLLIYFIAGIIAIIGGFTGRQPLFRLEKLNRGRILNSILVIAAVFTLLMLAWVAGYFPQTVAAPFMMFLYSFLAGFFAGYGWRLLDLRTRTGDILYMHRSFWIDHAPNLAVMLVILYGVYRTSLLLDQPVTGIRLTSGLSLIAFGFFGWTLRIVPEFRSGGILFIDRVLPWSRVIGWSWQSEEVIRIEYIHDPGKESERLGGLMTTIPPGDRMQVETILESKMEEYSDERRSLLPDRNRIF